MIHKDKLDLLKTFWTKEAEVLGGVDTPIPNWTGEKGGTLLQVAASADQEDITRWLLEDLHADPTLEVPIDIVMEPKGSDDGEASSRIVSRKTAYDIARSKGVRNVFRRCAATHSDWWDWLGMEKGGAHVPSVLTKEMEEGRDEKKKVHKKGLKDRIKERQERAAARAPSPTVEPKPVVEQRRVGGKKEESTTGPRKLGGSSGSGEGVIGLTPEMRARIERERRLRATEARLQALGGKK